MSNTDRTITEPDLQIRYSFCPTWQGIVFENQTFDEELDFEISEVEQILDDSDEEAK